jgi:hypothetical protein
VLQLLAIGLLLGAGGIAAPPASAWSGEFQRGDVFLTGGGGVGEYTPAGQLVQTVAGTSGASGLCFDPSGAHLILPGVGLFDDSGNLLPSHWARDPHGGHCVVDQSGNVYVSDPYVPPASSATFTKYDLLGNALQTFTVTPLAGRQSLGIDLAPDQCTMYFGEWNGNDGTAGRFNVCTNTQEPWPTSFTAIDDLRVLPDGHVLITDDPAGVLLDASGQVVHTYKAYLDSGVGNSLRYMSLDPDGTSFWMSGNGVVRYDINTGKLLSTWGTSPGGSIPGLGGPIAVYAGLSAQPPPPQITTTGNTPAPTTDAGGTGASSTAPSSGAGSSAAAGAAAPGLVAPSPSQIKALLSAVLVPVGQSVKIKTLVLRGGYSFSWAAPSAGLLAISWYQVPAGAHLSRARAPIQVATASWRLSRPGVVELKLALTATGKRLLRASRRAKLIARASFAPAGKHATTVFKAFTLTR